MTQQEMQELVRQYEALLSMFDTEGWSLFQKELEVTLDTLVKNAPIECHTNDQWQLRRGEIQKLMQFQGYENFIKESYVQLTSPVDEDDGWPE